MLIRAGADPNAPVQGSWHSETPLHWAASSDDVEVLEALLDAGAEIEVQGGAIGGGTPLDDAVAFGQWRVARRLVERGARSRLWHAAALGLLDRLEESFARTPPPTPGEVTEAFWQACHGGQRHSAEYLLARGADLNWVATWDEHTPSTWPRAPAPTSWSPGSVAEGRDPPASCAERRLPAGLPGQGCQLGFREHPAVDRAHVGLAGRPPGRPHRRPSLLTRTTRPPLTHTAAAPCGVPAGGSGGGHHPTRQS